MKFRMLLSLPLLAIALSGCVVAGGVNYHFPVGSAAGRD